MARKEASSGSGKVPINIYVPKSVRDIVKNLASSRDDYTMQGVFTFILQPFCEAIGKYPLSLQTTILDHPEEYQEAVQQWMNGFIRGNAQSLASLIKENEELLRKNMGLSEKELNQYIAGRVPHSEKLIDIAVFLNIDTNELQELIYANRFHKNQP